MNTPTTRLMRPRHVPTPKMSERKKDLFGTNSRSSIINLVIDEDSDLGPIHPLEYSLSPKSYDVPIERKLSFLINGFPTQIIEKYCPLTLIAPVNKHLSDGRLDFCNLMEQLSPAIKNSCRISQSDNSPRRITRSTPSTRVTQTADMMTDDIVMEKENNAEILLKTPALGNSVTTAPRISFRKAVNTSDCSNGTDSPKSRKTTQRRNVENKSDATETPKAKASLTFGEISAKCFYGTPNVETATKRSPVGRVPIAIKFTKKRATSASNRRYQNRGSGARKPILGSIRKLNNKFKPKKVVEVDALKKHSQLLDRIEKVIDSSKLSTYFKDLQANSFDKDLISGRARNILKESAQSPNKSAAHLPMDDKRFRSDDDSEPEEQEEPTKRKFFKSKSRSTQNRYQVAKGMSATVKRGHGIKLLSPPKKKQKIDDDYDELLSIRKEVLNIVKLLSSADRVAPTNVEKDKENACNVATVEMHSYEMDVQNDHSMYDNFRALIPYNTTDPTEIKRQETVLDILIENGICDEQNFKIFISEYEQHKDEAESILNNLFDISVSADANVQEQMWTPHDQAVIIDSTMQCSSTRQCSSTSGSVASNSIEKREFHPIFYKDHRPSDVKKDLLSVPVPKAFKWIPISDKQLQIDAGQKEFGSKNCSECGMFYTLHDPDDEILHQKFHNNMMGVLNFKVSAKIDCH